MSPAALRLHRPYRSAQVASVAGPREEVARAVSEHLGDELLADAILRTATEEVVGALAFNTANTHDLKALAKFGVTAFYAHPTQGLQRAAMHTYGRWQRVATHADVWRLDLSSIRST